MEAQLAETLTSPSQSYANSFFSVLPTDTRFLQCSYQKVMPTRSLDSAEIEFNLERFEAANVYVIQDILLELRIRIIDESTKKVPVKTKVVGPRNNVLHSIFSKVSLHINDTLITISSENYAYKAYVLNALTYPMTSKLTHVFTQGWVSDSAGYFNGTSDDTNSGFVERNLLFRDEFKRENTYREDGAIFIGRLLHDLIACETGNFNSFN